MYIRIYMVILWMIHMYIRLYMVILWMIIE